MPAYGWGAWSPGDKVTPYNYETYKKMTAGVNSPPPPRPEDATASDQFDADLAAARAKREIGMRLGVRSTFLIGPRGLEGRPYANYSGGRYEPGKGTGGVAGVDNALPGGRRTAPNTANMMAENPGPDTGGGSGEGSAGGSPRIPPTTSAAPPRPPDTGPRPPSPPKPPPDYNDGTWVIGAGGLAHPVTAAPPPQTTGDGTGRPPGPGRDGFNTIFGANADLFRGLGIAIAGIANRAANPSPSLVNTPSPSAPNPAPPGVSPDNVGNTFLTSDNPDDVLARLSRAKRMQGLSR